jgi:hypothetical protein
MKINIFSRLSNILFALLLSPVFLYSQDYIWPTNASEYMSSSFCEFREGHYHAAIDIKTWNTEGYPCYAIADGYIKRIRVSPFGYGKVLYLQLEDGNTVIYAHLQKFTKKVEKQLRQQQFKNKKYQLNWWPKNLKVKKGDIIAYTGRTGIGVPHLHFEIRNSQDHPINPLRFYTQIKDHKRPRLQNLLVVPLAHNSTVDDSFLPKNFSLSHVKDGIYVVKKPIVVKGKVGFAVRGYDQADDVYNKYGFYQSKLESEDKKIFQLTYDEIDYATTEHIYTEIYYPYWASDRQVFNKFYLEPFNPLRFYDRSLGADGTLTVSDNPVPFKITISDFMNNYSIIKGELLPATENSVEIVNSSIQDSLVYIKFSAPPIKDLTFSSKKNGQSWKPINYFEILEGRLNDPTENKLVKVNLEDSATVSIKIEVNNRYERTLSLETVDDETKFYQNITHLDDRLIGEFSGRYKNPRVETGKNQASVPFKILEENKIQVVLSSELIADSETILRMDDIHNKTTSINLNYHALFPGERRSYNWFDSTLVVASNMNSVTDTTLITAYKHELDSIDFGVPTASEIYEIKPDNFPIFESVSVSIRADSLPDWGQWSVFKTNGKNRFQYLPAKIDSTTLFFTSKTSSFGKFIVAADTVPPEVLIESPKSGKVYKSLPKIKVFLKDSLSGIGGEDHYSLSIDGNYVLPEWDPEEDIIIGSLDHVLASGNHIFTVTVRDRSGNTTRQAVYFKIQ